MNNDIVISHQENEVAILTERLRWAKEVLNKLKETN